MPCALGIDVGSTNVKVALLEDDGDTAAVASQPIATKRDGAVAEQDPRALWEAVRTASRAATAAAPGAAAAVAAVGVCSQYSSIVPVDASGAPTADLVLYLDQRGTPHSLAVMERHPEALEVWLDRHGIPPIGGGLSLGHVLAIQHERPDVHAATAAYLEPMDYVNLRLTGRVAATQCTMFMAQLCDNRSLGVTDYDADLVRLAGVDPAKLPGLVAPDAVIGTVLAEVADDLGIARSAVVTAGMNDSHAGAFATGACTPGRAGLAIGTTSVLLDVVDRKETDLDHEVLSMPSPVPGTYLVWAENGIGGKALETVLEHLVYADDVLGDHGRGDRFAALDEAMATSPPGARGALFLPWLTGSYAPRADGHMRGGFLNLSLDTRRTDLVRAVVEGTAHNAAWLLPVVERFTGTAVDEVVFGGGAARSTPWAQAMADVLARPVATLAEPDAAVARAVGLAALAHAGYLPLGELTDGAHVRRAARVEPRGEHVARYASVQEQFQAAFDALRPIYRALNATAR